MLALNYVSHGGIDALKLSDLEVPVLADDEVLIRVRAASINPFDWKLRSGELRDFFEVGFPITPGRDGCGDVVSLGLAVAKHATAGLLGQRVSFLSSRLQRGAFAEFVAVTARNLVTPAPTSMSDQECAALPMVGLSAWNALVHTAELQSGMKVLIHGGAGGVGSVAIQIARHIGAQVYATCRSLNTERVEDLGATAIAYDQVDFRTAVSECDVVLDTVGGKVHEESYAVLRTGGRLVYLVAAPFNDASERFDVELRRVDLKRSAGLSDVMALAAKGIIRSQVNSSHPLTEFARAYRLAESRTTSGKVVVELPPIE